MLLVAAANTSGLLEALETALSCCAPQAGSRLAHLSSSSRQSLLQTLLFLGVVGLSRPWGLRGYTGDALGSLPGRSRAYGYFHTERFLAELARSNGAEAFTSALARWTTRLWQSEVSALDLMRRVPDAPPGVMELLLVRALERFQSCGALVVSFGLVALADTSQEMTPVERKLVSLATDGLHLMEHRETLFNFKQKFQPS